MVNLTRNRLSYPSRFRGAKTILDQTVLAAVAVKHRENQIEEAARDPLRRITETFKAHYRLRPDLFMAECVRWPDGKAPTKYQIEAGILLLKTGRLSMRGPHGLGKTAFMALLILWFSLTRDGEDWKVITTAGTNRQLYRYLWPEVRKWARRLKWEIIGRLPFQDGVELQMTTLKLQTGEAFAVASTDASYVEGAHATHLMYVFDESKAIRDETWDAAEGASSTAGREEGTEALYLSCSTPGPPRGRFYEIQRRQPGYEDWTVRHVTKDEVMAAGQMTEEWADNRARQWGVRDPRYRNRVLGEFAEDQEQGVIPLAWLELAVERWKVWKNWRDYVMEYEEWREPVDTIGVDVARGGDDKSIIAPRYAWAIDSLIYFEHGSATQGDTMALANRCWSHLRRYMRARLQYEQGIAVVDVIGVGAGVVDRLRELGANVIAFNAAKKTYKMDWTEEFGFTNQRSWVWWNFRELLDPERGQPIAIPDDPVLIGDLLAPKWRQMAGGKIQVESREDIIKRLGRSPDAGTAVVMAYAEDTDIEDEMGLVTAMSAIA